MTAEPDGLGALRERARRLATELIAPQALEVDAQDSYPEHWFQALREENLLGLSVDTQYGGTSHGVRGMTVVTEELAVASSLAGLMMLLSRLPIAPILLYGDSELHERFVRPVATGQQRGAFAMSEAHSGSDVLGMTARAEPDGAAHRVTGDKCWISGVDEADWYAVVARNASEPPRSTRGLQVHIVSRDAPGVHCELVAKAGVRGSSLGHLQLDGASTVASIELPGAGGLLRILATMRPVVSARGLGLARAALELAAQWSRDREMNGEPLVQKQGIRWRLARLATSIESARLLTYQAADLVDAGDLGKDAVGLLAMAKLATSEVAVGASSAAVHLFGAAGCVTGHPAEVLHRDAIQLPIVEGTTEMQLEAIARSVLDDAKT